MKYVLVSGGVVSGLGKGITASSIGVILQNCGLRCTSIKIDPYLNKDAGTMSPYEHGEVFVLDDGGEADLDLGNYERFLNINLTKDHNITTGKIYDLVISKERRGDYLGKTVQVVPHITDAIQDWISNVACIPVEHSSSSSSHASTPSTTSPVSTPDVCIIELGGTVGDIESMVFLEALRQFQFRVGRDNFCHVHVSLVPVVGAVGEQKSKPIQHSVKELRAAGLTPDLIVCRSTHPLEKSVIQKISLFCMVPSSHVLSVHDVSNLYRVPLLLCQQRLGGMILSTLRINRMPPETLGTFQGLAERVDTIQQGITTVCIGVVGKYTGLSDSYLSVIKALKHASIHHDAKLKIEWIDSTQLEQDDESSWSKLKQVDGILIPGGFGTRGVEGKIKAAQYAREAKVPYLGICLGMQVQVIEYARSMGELKEANSTEFDANARNPVVIFMPEGSTTSMGATMRLGARCTRLAKGSLANQLYYGREFIYERHRHRYEVNPEKMEYLESKGLIFSGKDSTGQRMEIVELKSSQHPFYVGSQFHPEFQSRPFAPSPLFLGFIQAACGTFHRLAQDEMELLKAPDQSQAGWNRSQIANKWEKGNEQQETNVVSSLAEGQTRTRRVSGGA